MVYARLARRLRSLRLASFDDYVRYLELEPAEWEHCTNALTTNVTAFYREPHHFDVLAAHARATDSPMRVWSAGCSTGEEPYTIAMCLADSLGERAFQVVASDLDTQVLATASDAIFCRNVMIYFDKPTQRRLIERFAKLLKPRGLFFAGHAESLLDSGRNFRLRGQTVYEVVG